MFCDEPLPNLIVDLLAGVYGYPYHANLGKLLRLHYTAKATAMFADVVVFDQARYFYDLVPTLPLWDDHMPLSTQLVLRVCMDTIGRHAYTGYPSVFHGAALAAMGEEGFTVYRWPKREAIE